MKSINEERILNMIMSKDIELVKLGAISLLSLGEQVLLDFIEKYGKDRTDIVRKRSSIPISEKVIYTKIPYDDIEKRGGIYIRYISPLGETRRLYCGHTVSVFTGTANPDMPIVDFNDIKIN